MAKRLKIDPAMTLTLEVVTELVATWVAVKPMGYKDEAVLAWAADPATQAILAAVGLESASRYHGD